MDRKVDVGPLLLGLDDLGVPGTVAGIRQGSPHLVAEEMAEEDLDLGTVVAQSAQVDILALRLRGIVGRPVHPGGEILDPLDVVMGLEDGGEQRLEVEPLPRGPLEGTVIQIEAVDVDEGPHRPAGKSRGLRRGPAPYGRNRRGC
ncbi:MAG: hypothetical protein H7841_17765 [Magnetospirillum sp. WYHS-4]